MSTRNRTPSQIIGYGLYLYFLGLSFRNTANKALSSLHLVKISHVSIWHWIQKYKPRKYRKNKKIKEYIIDETAIKAGSSELIWLDWIVIEPTIDKEILAIDISKERNMFVAERFLSNVIKEYGKHPVSTDRGGTWYPHQACRFLKLVYLLHSFVYKNEKSIIEMTMQYIKDRTKECFDDYFPCKKNKYKLNHIKQWIRLFIDQHNQEIIS
jgi:putative transposase